MHNSCLEESEKRERENSVRYQFDTVSQLSFFTLVYVANMIIYIYSCCAVGLRTAAADLLSKSSSLHVLNDQNYLNLSTFIM